MENTFGQKLGEYILLDQLGEGGMAKVYNAFDMRIERNVAIKIILPSKQKSQIFLTQFLHEAKALAKLSHTNIVKVLDYGVEGKNPYLVMEFIQGGTLKKVLSEPLSWQKAAEVLEPIARSLEYVHCQNIIHRDIKPSNILLDTNDRPLLSDFGIVQIVENTENIENSVVGVGIGTPDYMAPEQVEGKEIDFRADIYSLGVMFYEMITGSTPFKAETPMAVAIQHVTNSFPLPRKANKRIPAFVEKALLRSVHKNPEMRYSSMGEFADVLGLLAMGKRAPKKKIIKLSKSTVKHKQENRRFALLLSLFLIIGIFLFPLRTYLSTSLDKIDTQNHQSANIPPPATTTISAAAIEKNTPSIPTPHPTYANENAIQPSTYAIKNETNLTLLGTPIASPTSSTEEVARWGLGQVNDMAWAPNGKTLAIGAASGIYLYNDQSHSLEMFIDPGFLTVKIIFSPDGSYITAGSIEGNVKSWSVQTGELVREFTYQSRDIGRVVSKHSRVTGISYSLNSANIAIGHENGIINYFFGDQSRPTLILDQIPTVNDIAISADGRFLYTANGEKDIFVWDITTGNIISQLSNPTPIDKFAFSKDRSLLLCAGRGTNLYLWDLTRDSLVASFPYLESSITKFDISHDKKNIAVSLDGGKMQIFPVPNTESYTNVTTPSLTLKSNTEIQTLKFSPKDDKLFVGNWNMRLAILAPNSGKEIYALGESVGGIERINLSANGQWLASAHHDNIVRIWRMDISQETYRFEGYLPKGKPFSLDNRYIAFIQSAEEKSKEDTIQIVDLENGNIIASLPGYIPKAFIRFTDDSALLIMGTPYNAVIWDVATWEKIKVHGGSNAGCGHYSTPQNNEIVIISDAGMLFTQTQDVATLCGTKPNGATLVYYFPKQRRAIFVLGNGQLLNWRFTPITLQRINMTSTYPLPDEIFLAGDRNIGLYAGKNKGFLSIYQANGQRILSIPGQSNYEYQVAFASDREDIMVLGSKYGSIHVWALH